MNETLEQFISRTMADRKTRRQQGREQKEEQYKKEDEELEEVIKMIEHEIERKQRGE